MHLEIEEVVIKDYYETLSAMMRELHRSEKELFDKTEDWDNIAVDYLKHVMNMQEEAAGICLLAWVDEEPAGFMFGYEEEADESRIEAYIGVDGYISDGFIYAHYRRHGIYKKLNSKMEELFISRGIRRIIRFTLTSNTRMQQFLESKQYQPVRLLYEKWLDTDGITVLPLMLSPPEKGK